MNASKIIPFAFCVLGFWLVWQYRLFGLFTYAAILFSVSLSGIFETEVMPKSEETRTIKAMYWIIFVICAIGLLLSFSDILKPLSIAVAKGAQVPSFYDNVVILLEGSQEDAAQLLADVDCNKRRKILHHINYVQNTRNSYAQNTYFAFNLISLTASFTFIALTSFCVTKSRLPYIDEARISEMNAISESNITHKKATWRILFCLFGLIGLALFFRIYVTSQIGLESVGGFSGMPSHKGGNLPSIALFYQAYAFFLLWHFAKYPFGLKRHEAR